VLISKVSLAFAAERQVVRQTPVTNASGLTLVVLRCADLERSRRFYEAIGLTLMPEQHGAGPRHYSARVGKTVLEFYPDASGSTRGLRLGIELVDLAAAVSALARVGVIPRSGAPVTIDDPDGHRLELHPVSAA
jgi:lactoylglutathione lyase